MRVEMLPAELVALDPVTIAAVDPTVPLALINPRCSPDRIIEEVGQLLPEVDPVDIAAAVLAALRAHEVEELEIAVSMTEIAHPAEVTDVRLKALVGAGTGWTETVSIALDDTQPVARVVDPGITVDDVPPYPPGAVQPRRRPTAHPLPLVIIGLLAFLGLVLPVASQVPGAPGIIGPSRPDTGSTKTVPRTGADAGTAPVSDSTPASSTSSTPPKAPSAQDQTAPKKDTPATPSDPSPEPAPDQPAPPIPTVPDPGTGTTDPGTGTVPDPGTGTGTGGTTDPGTGTTDPGTGTTPDPGTGTGTGGTTDPGTGTTDPGTGTTPDPGTGTTPPDPGTDPGTTGGDVTIP